MRIQGHTAFFILVICCFSKNISSQCNDVDALTSASFRITGGEACSTSISLDWTYRRDNGEMTIEWGTSTQYGDSKSIYSQNPINITNLTPNTEYFFHTYGYYRNRTYEYYTFSVTTAAGSPPNEAPEITSAEAVSCTTGQTTTYTVTATDNDDDEITFTAQDLPDWISFESPELTLNPLPESNDAEITLIADDGNGGSDTLLLSVEVIVSTSVRASGIPDNTLFLPTGATGIAFSPNSSRYITITLHKLNGAAIFQRKIPPSSLGEFSLPAQIPSGVYLLRLSNEKRVYGYTLNIRN